MGETEDEFPAMTAVVNDYFDAMSLERGRGFVTLAVRKVFVRCCA